MMGIYPSSLPSLLRTPSLNLLPPTLLQLVLLSPTPLQHLKIHIVPTFQSFVPIATRSMTEQKAVHQSVQERQLSPSTSSSATMMWPLLEEFPCINEFTTKGYFTCAFPTLFPTGAGDFSGPSLQTTVC